MKRVAGSLGTRGSHTVTLRRRDPAPMNQTIHIHVASPDGLAVWIPQPIPEIFNIESLITAEETAFAHFTRRISADADPLARRHGNRWRRQADFACNHSGKA